MSLILTLTGMSTCGKSTLAKALTATGAYAEAVSVTTRDMRPGEVNGKDYHFVTQDVFDQYVRDGQLLEHVKSHHACYGVPAFEVDRIQSAGMSVVMVLEPEGVFSIQKIAREKNENFLAAFVHVDTRVLIERFFLRIEQAKAAGKTVSFDQEAKRLHVMFSKERGWSGRFEWDMTLMNLHLGDNLFASVDQFVGFHEKSQMFKPVERTLKPEIPIECVAQSELAKMIKDHVEKPGPVDVFIRKAMSPWIEIQAKIRYQDGVPSPAM